MKPSRKIVKRNQETSDCGVALQHFRQYFTVYKQKRGTTAANRHKCGSFPPGGAFIMRKQKARHSNKGIVNSGNPDMPDFDVDAFISKLDGMGMKLTAIPLADGKFRVSRWCMMKANDHAQQIQELWTRQIGDNQQRIDVLAAHLVKLASRETARYVSSGHPQAAAAGAK
jgi:hypothetical protein